MARPVKKDQAFEPEEESQESVENVTDEAAVVADFEEVFDFDDEDVAAASANDSKFTCSTDVRRKIEEREELKMLRDELGFDDTDFE